MSGVLSMSEQNTPNLISDLVGVESDKNFGSPGELLRVARETAGVHIAALAGALKVPVSKLEALESDNFSALSDAVFARALASSICRILDLDPVPVLKLMPKNQSPSFSVASSDINTSFKDNSRKIGRSTLLEHAKRPISVIVVLLLLGILALLFLPFGSDLPVIAGVEVKSDLRESDPENNAILNAPFPSTTNVIADVGSPIEQASVPQAVILMPSALVMTTPEVSEPAKLLEFRAQGESWVQVRDATKAVIFERTLTKGEVASTTGILPLTVVIGRADATEVYIHGKVFALADVAKENVARFEVKQ